MHMKYFSIQHNNLHKVQYVKMNFHFHNESIDIGTSVTLVLCAPDATFCAECKNNFESFISFSVQKIYSIS